MNLLQYIFVSKWVADVCGHRTLKAPHPVRSAKLSKASPSQYCGGGPRGDPRCCSSFFDFVSSRFWFNFFPFTFAFLFLFVAVISARYFACGKVCAPQGPPLVLLNPSHRNFLLITITTPHSHSSSPPYGHKWCTAYRQDATDTLPSDPLDPVQKYRFYLSTTFLFSHPILILTFLFHLHFRHRPRRLELSCGRRKKCTLLL